MHTTPEKSLKASRGRILGICVVGIKSLSDDRLIKVLNKNIKIVSLVDLKAPLDIVEKNCILCIVKYNNDNKNEINRKELLKFLFDILEMNKFIFFIETSADEELDNDLEKLNVCKITEERLFHLLNGDDIDTYGILRRLEELEQYFPHSAGSLYFVKHF
jgi:hypothetical protein